MKVLIYKRISDLRPIGGPSGYNYNLKKGLDLLENTGNVEFKYLNDDEEINKNKNYKNKLYVFFKKKIIPFLGKNIRVKLMDNYVLHDCKNVLKGEENSSFSDYDVVHFHSTLDMYKNRKALENYNGKVVLSSHCPKAQHRELIDDVVSSKCVKKNTKLFNSMKNVDKWCFENASYIFFPCEEALEPYFESWNEFKEIYSNNRDKFRYILSGLSPVSAKNSKLDIREKYKIPEDAKVVSFVGRHNFTKGYDTLIKLFEKCPDIYFLLAGSTSSIEYPKDKRWIEVGWTNDPYSIVNAADLFILPNKQTYFDLVLLEVLSLGIPVLLTKTGGNKHFEKYQQNGIMYFDSIEEAKDKINMFFKQDILDRKIMSEENRKLFMDNFESKKFAFNYCKLIESL